MLCALRVRRRPLAFLSFDGQLLLLATGDADALWTAHLAKRNLYSKDTLLVAGFNMVSINGFREGDGSLETY